MGLTVTDPLNGPISIGSRWLTIRKVSHDATYPAGGEALTKTDLGFVAAPDVVIPIAKGGYLYEYDAANEKLFVWYGDNNNASDGPFVENATADISAAAANIFVISIGKHRL